MLIVRNVTSSSNWCLDDLVFDGEYAKIVHTHGKFGVNPHSIIIDIDRHYIPKQVTIADKTYTKIG